MKKVLSLFIIVVVFAFSGCESSTSNNASTKDTTTFDLQKETAWVKENVLKFSEAFRRGDSVAVAAYYGEDVLVMPPNSPALGRKDVASMWGGAMRMGVKDIKLNVQDVTGNEEILVETGTYEMLGDNNISLEKGKYLTVLKKQNGDWKVFRDIWNLDTSVPPAK